MRILILSGGSSNEREVSLRSGANIRRALAALGHDIRHADPDDANLDLPTLASEVDMVLPILHGAGGEDGSIQQMLDELGVAYLGSDANASRLAFDKMALKQLLQREGVTTPQAELVDRAGFDRSSLRHSPYVLKPIDGGSSIDTLIARDPQGANAVARELLERYPEMMIEQLIVGDELTVGVLGEEALPVILIVPPEGAEFDYENKYNGATQEITNPKRVPKRVQEQAQEAALRVHRLSGARHFSRTDIIVDEKGNLHVLELNTIPGLTEQSLLPRAAAAAGYDLKSFAQKLIDMVLVQ